MYVYTHTHMHIYIKESTKNTSQCPAQESDPLPLVSKQAEQF